MEQLSIVVNGAVPYLGATEAVHIIGEVSEHDMIAVFLQTEIRAPRYASELLQLLEQDGVSRMMVDAPDTTNDRDNAYRLHLFTRFRGYGHRQGYFESFPRNVRWQRVLLRPDELLQAK